MATSLSIWRRVPSVVRSRFGMSSRPSSLPGEGSFGASRGWSSGKARHVVGRAKKRPVVVDRWTRPSTPTAPDASEASAPPKWDEFAAHVSGSWNGFNAEFNMFGEPLKHESVHECTTLAHPEIGRLSYKLIADATSAEECDATQIAYHSRGSYTSVWRGEEVEQCLAHEKTRIRVFQKLGSRRHIRVFRESLGGGVPAFADDAKLKAGKVLGKWNSNIYRVKLFHPQEGYTSSELTLSGTEVVQRTPMNTFLYGWLPKDMWTLLLKTESGGTTIETGWLADPDLLIVTKCEVASSGDLKDASLRVEKRISREVPPVKVSAKDLADLLSE